MGKVKELLMEQELEKNEGLDEEYQYAIYRSKLDAGLIQTDDGLWIGDRLLFQKAEELEEEYLENGVPEEYDCLICEDEKEDDEGRTCLYCKPEDTEDRVGGVWVDWRDQ